MVTPEMIPNVDQYLIDAITYVSVFVTSNPITIGAVLAVLKAIAKVTKSTKDDRVYTLLVNSLNKLVPGRYNTSKKITSKRKRTV